MHGTGGVALLYKNIFELTDQEIYKKACDYWINETLEYLEVKMDKTFANHDLEILTGWLGPLLLLYDYSYGKVSRWDSFFLV